MIKSSPTTVTESVAVAKKPLHPLMKFTPVTWSRDFADWLKKWEESEYLYARIGMLDTLISDGHLCWRQESLPFLLQVADGHADSGNFADKGPFCSSRDSVANNRQLIAKKALEILRKVFFAEGNKDWSELSLWWWVLEHEDSLQKLLWFLRCDEHFRMRLYNYRHHKTDRSEGEEKMFVFLQKFARLGWDFTKMADRYSSSDETVKIRLAACRPQFIDILYEIGQIGWLRNQPLCEVSVQKLTSMAMNQDISLPLTEVGQKESRRPANLRQAAIGGSACAELVLLRELRMEEAAAMAESYRQDEERIELEEKLANMKKPRVKA